MLDIAERQHQQLDCFRSVALVVSWRNSNSFVGLSLFLFPDLSVQLFFLARSRNRGNRRHLDRRDSTSPRTAYFRRVSVPGIAQSPSNHLEAVVALGGRFVARTRNGARPPVLVLVDRQTRRLLSYYLDYIVLCEVVASPDPTWLRPRVTLIDTRLGQLEFVRGQPLGP